MSDHAEDSLLAGISGHQTRCFRAAIDDPDCPDYPRMSLLSLRRHQAVDNILFAVGGFQILDDFAGLSHCAKRADESLWIRSGDPSDSKNCALPPLSGCREFSR